MKIPQIPFHGILNGDFMSTRPRKKRYTFTEDLLDIKEEDIVVLIMGDPSAGKTTFINAAANALGSTVKFGDTAALSCIKIPISDNGTKTNLVLVESSHESDYDRPGSWRSTFDELTSWTSELRNRGEFRIRGIVFIKSIGTSRMYHSDALPVMYMRNQSEFENARVMCLVSQWNRWAGISTYSPELQNRHDVILQYFSRNVATRYSDPPPGRFDERFAERDSLRALRQLFDKVAGAEALMAQIAEKSGRWRDMKPHSKGKATTAQAPSIKPATVAEKVTAVRVKDIQADDIVIGVMGETGAGKSSFITALTGGKASDIKVESGVHSGPRDVRAVRLSIFDRNVVLVDFPGFNDTDSEKYSDIKVLEVAAKWLIDLRNRKVLLHGIIYLETLDLTRSASRQKIWNIFRAMYGTTDYNRVTLVTTNWDYGGDPGSLVRKGFHKAEERLKDGSWKTFLTGDNDSDAPMCGRFAVGMVDGVDTDPSRILAALLKRISSLKGIEIRIQMELKGTFTLFKTIKNTSAGKVASREYVPIFQQPSEPVNDSEEDDSEDV